MHNNLDDKYVVLWSPYQGQLLGSEKFGNMLKKNMETFKKQEPGGDYILLAIVDTPEECRAFMDKIKAETPSPKWD